MTYYNLFDHFEKKYKKIYTFLTNISTTYYDPLVHIESMDNQNVLFKYLFILYRSLIN